MFTLALLGLCLCLFYFHDFLYDYPLSSPLLGLIHNSLNYLDLFRYVMDMLLAVCWFPKEWNEKNAFRRGKNRKNTSVMFLLSMYIIMFYFHESIFMCVSVCIRILVVFSSKPLDISRGYWCLHLALVKYLINFVKCLINSPWHSQTVEKVGGTECEWILVGNISLWHFSHTCLNTE